MRAAFNQMCTIFHCLWSSAWKGCEYEERWAQRWVWGGTVGNVISWPLGGEKGRRTGRESRQAEDGFWERTFKKKNVCLFCTYGSYRKCVVIRESWGAPLQPNDNWCFGKRSLLCRAITHQAVKKNPKYVAAVITCQYKGMGSEMRLEKAPRFCHTRWKADCSPKKYQISSW